MRGGFLTYSSALVLQAVASGYCYGFDIMDATGLPSGTVYPALRKLERDKFVRSSWENERKAYSQARPARRNYTITALGARALAEVVQRFKGLDRRLSAPAES